MKQYTSNMQRDNSSSLKDFLDSKYDEFCRPEFISSDPISIPHGFTSKQDIEISGFFAATIAWGKRPMIIKNSNRLMDLMDNDPYSFILNHSEKDLKRFDGFVHRTFNADDVRFFCKSLHQLYSSKDSLEDYFLAGINPEDKDLASSIHQFKSAFFSLNHEQRTQKHVADPLKGSAAKRINMYLRWMVRSNDRGVDFGIWNRIPASLLSCPLDVHSGRVARKLGILNRNQNDWKAVSELDISLRKMNPKDPVKYDYSLFGLGVFEGF
jgi:uncharacterized protein (TIGR02757 family)